MGSSFLLVIILSRYLQPFYFGEFTFINAIILGFQPLINFELNTILIREISRDSSSKDVFVSSALILKIILIFFFICSLFVLIKSIDFPFYLKTALLIVAFGEVCQQVSWVFISIFQSFERMEFETVVSFIFRCFSIAGVIFVLLSVLVLNLLRRGFCFQLSYFH